jgi:hypothetical protein
MRIGLIFRLCRQARLLAMSASLLAWCAGCRTSHPFPPVDVSAPGWRVQEGQALWKPPGKRPELAGDILIATNQNGNFFVQFSKTPFPLVTASVTEAAWQIQFGANTYSWRGRGKPPQRFLGLPEALSSKVHDGRLQMSNPRSGETLDLRLFR